MLHDLIEFWFHFLETWGYLGVFILMALESTIVPIPSELVVPPAAFWAAQGRLDISGVIIAATAGSYFGSAVSYLFFQAVGPRFIHRYGKYLRLSPIKIKSSQVWIEEYGTAGIFFARLLPVVRHVISIPAGFFNMNFTKFSVATILGSAIWCSILAFFGKATLGSHPDLLNSPEDMISAIKADLIWFIVGAVILLILFIGSKAFQKRQMRHKTLTKG